MGGTGAETRDDERRDSGRAKAGTDGGEGPKGLGMGVEGENRQDQLSQRKQKQKGETSVGRLSGLIPLMKMHISKRAGI